MATIEEILGKCSVEELRFAAHDNGVSDKGRKAELVIPAEFGGAT